LPQRLKQADTATRWSKVAAGEADIAAIDAVTFALLQRIEPQLTAQVRVIGKTAQVPGLPYITSTTANR
jgi:ABC-type phosphate/phosphonate transport system substrate-binding protein